MDTPERLFFLRLASTFSVCFLRPQSPKCPCHHLCACVHVCVCVCVRARALCVVCECLSIRLSACDTHKRPRTQGSPCG